METSKELKRDVFMYNQYIAAMNFS